MFADSLTYFQLFDLTRCQSLSIVPPLIKASHGLLLSKPLWKRSTKPMTCWRSKELMRSSPCLTGWDPLKCLTVCPLYEHVCHCGIFQNCREPRLPVSSRAICVYPSRRPKPNHHSVSFGCEHAALVYSLSVGLCMGCLDAAEMPRR